VVEDIDDADVQQNKIMFEAKYESMD